MQHYLLKTLLWDTPLGYAPLYLLKTLLWDTPLGYATLSWGTLFEGIAVGHPCGTLVCRDLWYTFEKHDSLLRPSLGPLYETMILVMILRGRKFWVDIYF